MPEIHTSAIRSQIHGVCDVKVLPLDSRHNTTKRNQFWNLLHTPRRNSPKRHTIYLKVSKEKR
jgi:hypothetical protein